MKQILLAGIAVIALTSAVDAQQIPQNYPVDQFLEVCSIPDPFYQGFCAGVINGVGTTLSCPNNTGLNLVVTTEEIISWMRGDMNLLRQDAGKTIKKAMISLYGCTEKLPSKDQDLNFGDEEIPGEVEL